MVMYLVEWMCVFLVFLASQERNLTQSHRLEMAADHLERLRDGKVVILAINGVKVSDDLIEMAVEIVPFSTVTFYPGENELWTAMRRMRILDNQGTIWNFRTENRQVCFAKWEDTVKFAVKPGHTAALSVGRYRDLEVVATDLQPRPKTFSRGAVKAFEIKTLHFHEKDSTNRTRLQEYTVIILGACELVQKDEKARIVDGIRLK